MASEIPILVLPRGVWPVRADKTKRKGLVELLLRIALVAVAFPLLCMACGWCLLARIPDLDAEERFGAAGGVGAAYLAAAAFITFLTGWPLALVGGAALLVLVF